MKFQVEELAKIEKATIEVKNLTIFVGKNSTNKSYMAHTVYMLNKSFLSKNITYNINSSFNTKDNILGDIILNSNKKIADKEFYFPASRTGFVLAFDEIVSGVLRNRFTNKKNFTKLTEPTIDFILEFYTLKSGQIGKNNLNKNIFNFIEDRIIKGKIIEQRGEENNIQLFIKPQNSLKLDLHLTSSSSLEVLPLAIFLKHFETLEDKLLVIEEPEAHLHPKAQIEMARLLVMLSNAGAKVLITTHSDYILNELSNCIKLNYATDEKQKKYLNNYKLDKDTIISADRVSAYLFKDIDKKTKVEELTIDKYGIANDNFDDILDELLDRTDEINEMVL